MFLKIKTTQISNMKVLATSLKDILCECNFCFLGNGIQMTTLDKMKNTLVDVFLPSENFDSYLCQHIKIVIALDIQQFHKIIHTLETDDELTIYIDEMSGGIVSHLKFKFENEKRTKHHSLKLIEPETEMVMPEIEYSNQYEISSMEFKKIIKSTLADTIQICASDQLIFKSEGSFAESSAELKNVNVICQAGKVEQLFSLKKIMPSTKLCCLTDSLTLSLEKEKPLIVTYRMELGTVRLCLTAI
jgi:proliferating cell nuclear antigen PCNA